VQLLGLWHFLPLGTSADDAILRIEFSLVAGHRLHLPDWRHNYGSFYFAPQPVGSFNGYTRDLRNGSPGGKEWVVPSGDAVGAASVIADAKVLRPSVGYPDQDLPPEYWRQLDAEIGRAMP